MLAHISWGSVVVSMLAGRTIPTLKTGLEGFDRWIGMAVPAALAFIGLTSGIVALISTRRYGRAGIFGPALAGVLLWSLGIAATTIVILSLKQ